MDGLNSNTSVQMGTDRSFGVVFFLFFVILGSLPLIDKEPVNAVLLFTGVGILGVALVIPKALRPFNRVWFYFGLLLQRVVSPIVLGILFFIVITPMGLAMRPFRADPLRLKKNKLHGSYWIKKDIPTTKETFKRQF